MQSILQHYYSTHFCSRYRDRARKSQKKREKEREREREREKERERERERERVTQNYKICSRTFIAFSLLNHEDDFFRCFQLMYWLIVDDIDWLIYFLIPDRSFIHTRTPCWEWSIDAQQRDELKIKIRDFSKNIFFILFIFSIFLI